MTDIAKQVLAILDPPARTEKIAGRKVSVFDDAYYNLEGAIQNLRHEGASKSCIKTLERVQQKIAKVVRLCEQNA